MYECDYVIVNSIMCMWFCSGGLRAGDIITEINGKAIQSAADVYSLVEAFETLKVVACRGQRKMTFTIVSEEVN